MSFIFLGQTAHSETYEYEATQNNVMENQGNRTIVQNCQHFTINYNIYKK